MPPGSVGSAATRRDAVTARPDPLRAHVHASTSMYMPRPCPAGMRRLPRHERRRQGEDEDAYKHPGLWGPSGVVVVTAITLYARCSR